MNNWKPIEFMAEKVLGWETETHPIGLVWITPDTQHSTMKSEHLAEYFYSPEGFFAVWDSYTEVATKHGWWIAFHTQEGVHEVRLHNIHGYDSFKGKDRYEAFYNAVVETMKDE